MWCARKNAHGISREPGAVRELEKVMEGKEVFQARKAQEKMHKNYEQRQKARKEAMKRQGTEQGTRGGGNMLGGGLRNRTISYVTRTKFPASAFGVLGS